MDDVRFAILGYGGMGSHHARYIDAGDVPGAKVVAAYDSSPERLEAAKKNHGEDFQVFDDADALFEAGICDAVLIATPHYQHPPLAIKAFEHGLHVLTEKPSGVYTKQVREMNEAAEKSGKVFGIMFQSRTRPVNRKMKDMVESGELGEMLRTNWIITAWFRSQSYYDSGEWRATWAGEGGGVLINQCPHNLDIWQWIAGMPKRVHAFCAFGKYHDIEVEDDVTAYVEYENGATGLFVTTTGEAPGTDRFEITGDNGKLVLEGGSLTFWRTRVPVSKFNKEFKGGFGSPEVWKCDIPVGGGGEGHQGITRDFVRAIREGGELIAPGTEGLKGLELSNAMLLSAWTDSWVDIAVDEDRFHELLQEKIKGSRYQKKSAGKTLDVKTSWK